MRSGPVVVGLPSSVNRRPVAVNPPVTAVLPCRAPSRPTKGGHFAVVRRSPARCPHKDQPAATGPTSQSYVELASQYWTDKRPWTTWKAGDDLQCLAYAFCLTESRRAV
uniref:Uncharacterized protein n=1 Tax=Eutreptiella gymnastica TaxID=73025 RepID=A0A7S4GKE4_9EUGL